MSTEPRQSTNHLYLVEPAVFYANPETLETNNYQEPDRAAHADIFKKALAEFRAFRDLLIEHGVFVTTAKGIKECPDHIFPNWFMTHPDRTYSLYPMMNENRRKERTAHEIAWLERHYSLRKDYSAHENEGRFLESSSALWLDRLNRIAYVALSPRVDEGLARAWCEENSFRPVIFETRGHNGKPVYHTDVVMHIGTDFAGICAESLLDDYRESVLRSLRESRDVIELTKEQMRAFAGNALEVLGKDGEKYLVMSDSAYESLREDQREQYLNRVSKIIHAPLPTIEQYGGGSARCMLQELF